MITSYWDVPDLRPNPKPGTLPTSIMSVPADAIPSAEAQLWRFMDFPKLVSILDTKALFFTRADKLEDRFEGAWSNATLQLLEGAVEREVIEQDEHVVLRNNITGQSVKLVRPFSTDIDPTERQAFNSILSNIESSELQFFNSGRNLVIRHLPTGQRFIAFDFVGSNEKGTPAVVYPLLDRDRTIATSRQLARASKDRSRFTMINCWYESEHESEAMWRLYSGDKYGIAIKTNVKSLANSFVGRYPGAIAKIQYIPYDEEVMPLEVDTPFLYKRINFAHEREVRVIMTQYVQYQDIDGNRNTVQIDFSNDVCEIGLYYDIEPEQLIHEIAVGPYTTPWVMDLIRSVAKKYGLDVPVVRSTLTQQPTW